MSFKYLPVIKNDNLPIKRGEQKLINNDIFIDNNESLLLLRIEILFKLSKYNFDGIIIHKKTIKQKYSILINKDEYKYTSYTIFKEDIINICDDLMTITNGLIFNYRHVKQYNDEIIYINKMIRQLIPNTDHITNYKTITAMLNLMITNIIIIGYFYLNNIINAYTYGEDILTYHREDLEKIESNDIILKILQSSFLSEDNKYDIIEIINGINEILRLKFYTTYF